LATPRSWDIRRKDEKFILKSRPGPHNKESSIPLAVLCRDVLEIGSSLKEIRTLLNAGQIMVDGIKRKDKKFPVGFMDVVTVGKSNYRLIFDKKGRIRPVTITSAESKKKVAMITGKRMVKGGKIQLSLHDGKNILLSKAQGNKYSTEGSLVIELPTQKIIDYLPFKKGMLVFVNGGKHFGETAIIDEAIDVQSPHPDRVILKSNGTSYETLQRYAFVVGEKKPVVKIDE
jgi:small subunit ribosomal protein S4e